VSSEGGAPAVCPRGCLEAPLAGPAQDGEGKPGAPPRGRRRGRGCWEPYYEEVTPLPSPFPRPCSCGADAPLWGVIIRCQLAEYSSMLVWGSLQAGPTGREYVPGTSSAALSLLSSRLEPAPDRSGGLLSCGTPSHAHVHSHLGAGVGLGAGPGHTGASILSLAPIAGGTRTPTRSPSHTPTPPLPPAPHPIGSARGRAPDLASPVTWVLASRGLHPITTQPRPPGGGDDKDGHYVFELGDNLTPRCECPPFLPADTALVHQPLLRTEAAADRAPALGSRLWLQ